MAYNKTFEAWLASNPPWAINQGIAGPTGGASNGAGSLAPAAQPGYSLSPDVSSGTTEQSDGPNLLQRFLAGLGVLENAVVGGVHGAQEIQQEGRSGNLDIADLMRVPGGIASGFSEGLQSVFGDQDKIKYGQDVAIGEYAMGRPDPMGFDTSKYGEATKNMTAEQYNEYIDKVVKPEYLKYQQTDSPGETVARGVGGFAADVAFDPLTYVSLGLVPLAKQAMKKFAPEAAAKVAGSVDNLAETKPKTASFIQSIGERPRVINARNMETPEYDALRNVNVPDGVSPGVAVAAQADNLAKQQMELNLTQETLGSPGPVGFKGLPIESGPQPLALGPAPTGQAELFPADQLRAAGPAAMPPVAPQLDAAAQQIPGQQSLFPNIYEQQAMFPEAGLRAAGPQAPPAAPVASALGNGNPMEGSQREILFTKKGEPAKAALPVDVPSGVIEAGGSSHYWYNDGSAQVFDAEGTFLRSYPETAFVTPEAAMSIKNRLDAGKPIVDKSGNILGSMGNGRTGKIAAKNIAKEPTAGMVPVFYDETGAAHIGNIVDTINGPKKMPGLGELPQQPVVPRAAEAVPAPAATKPAVAKEKPSSADIPRPDVVKAKAAVPDSDLTFSGKRVKVSPLEKAVFKTAISRMFNAPLKKNVFGFKTLSQASRAYQVSKGKVDVNIKDPGGAVSTSDVFTINIAELLHSLSSTDPEIRRLPFIYNKSTGKPLEQYNIAAADAGEIDFDNIGLRYAWDRNNMESLGSLVDNALQHGKIAMAGDYKDLLEEMKVVAEASGAQAKAAEPVVVAKTADEANAATPQAEAVYEQQKALENLINKTPEQPAHRLDSATGDGRPKPTLQFEEKNITPRKLTKEEKAAERKNVVLGELIDEMVTNFKKIYIQPVEGQAWRELTEKESPELWKVYQEQGFEALASKLSGRVAQGVNTIAMQANLVRNARGIISRFFPTGSGRNAEGAGFTRDLIGKSINPSRIGFDPLEAQTTARLRAENAWVFLKTMEDEAVVAGAAPVASLGHRIPMRLSDRLEIAANDIGIPKEWMLIPPGGHEAAALLSEAQREALILFWKNSDYIDGTFDVARYSGGKNRSAKQLETAFLGRVETYKKLKEYFPSLDGNFGGPAKMVNGAPSSKPTVPGRADVKANPTAATGQAVAAGADPSVVAQINKDSADTLIDDIIEPEVNAGAGGGVDDITAMMNDAKMDRPEYRGGQRFLSWHSAVMGHRNLQNFLWNNLGVGKRIGGDFDHWLKEIVDLKAEPEDILAGMQSVINRTITGTRGAAHSPDKAGEVAAMIEDRIVRLFDKKSSIMTRANVTDKQLIHYLRGLGVKLPSTMTKGQTDNYFVDIMIQMQGSLLSGKDQLKFISQFQGALNRAMTNNFLHADIMANLGSPIKTATHTTKFGNHYFEPDVARQLPSLINKFEELNTYSANGRAFFEVIDDVMGVWKTLVTIPRPGHHVRNMVGDLFMSWLSNPRFMGNPAAMSRDFKRAVQILRHHEDAYGGVIRGQENLDEISALVEQLAMGDRTGLNASLKPKGQHGTAATEKMITVAGRSMSSSDVYNQAFNRGLLQNAHIIEDIGSLEGSKFTATTKVRQAPYVKQMGWVTNTREHAVRLMDFVGDLEYGLNKKFKGRKDVSDQEWNAAIQEIADASAARVRKAHPDGLKLTPQERNYWRRAMPFYSYTRGIIPAVAEYAIANPGRAVAPMKFYRNMQQSITGQDSEYGYDLNGPRYPSWMYENYGMGPLFTMGAAAGGQSLIGNDLYGIGSYDVPRMLLNPGDNALGMMNPIPKWGIEAATSRNLQTGQDITDWPEYLLKQIPMSNLFMESAKPGNQDLTWPNFLTGARLTEMNKPSYITSAEFEKKAKQNG
jgi:hypothetical protein